VKTGAFYFISIISICKNRGAGAKKTRFALSFALSGLACKKV
jgi:hypothetical protein